MLQLFQSIFSSGRGESSSHPAELIERATERAVEGTDSRLKAVPGYRKKLRAAVIHAIDHVVELVDGFPAPLDLQPRSYGEDAEITAYFVSVEHLREVLDRDATLGQWRRCSEGVAAAEVFALLLMTLQERKTLGVALDGDTLRHDVAQTTVSLSKHQLADPAGAEGETRRLLKRRAFDHLLALALGRMAATRNQRSDLERERDLLRRKRAALAAGQWGFETGGADKPVDPRDLQEQLESIETQFGGLRAGSASLQGQFDILLEVLTHARDGLWSARQPLVMDRMGVKQARATELAPEVGLTVLHNAAGQSLIARLIRVARAALPPQRDLLREAERYLG